RLPQCGQRGGGGRLPGRRHSMAVDCSRDRRDARGSSCGAARLSRRRVGGGPRLAPAGEQGRGAPNGRGMSLYGEHGPDPTRPPPLAGMTEQEQRSAMVRLLFIVAVAVLTTVLLGIGKTVAVVVA